MQHIDSVKSACGSFGELFKDDSTLSKPVEKTAVLETEKLSSTCATVDEKVVENKV